jgi:putative ABC transport system permease protein
LGIVNIVKIFLLEYYKTHKLKSLFSFLGISLGVALFITTNLNGRRAERSLIDFSTGYLDSQFTLRIFHSDPSKGIESNLVSTLYEKEEFRWITSIYPRVQKTLFLKQGSTTQKIIYIGVDFFLENEKFQTSNSSEDQSNFLLNSYFSPSAKNLILNNKLAITYRENPLYFQNIKEIDSDGGNFILEDLSLVEKRFGEENFKFDYLLINSEVKENQLQALKDFLTSLDKGLGVETPGEIQERAGSALKSYNLNLVIISMISVIIAFFMVSNTMSGIYISRRKELGILRSLGTTPFQSLVLFQLQALVLGFFGSAFGIYLGTYLAGFRFFSGELTVSDTSQAVSYTFVPNLLILIGFLIGLGGSFISALIPSIRSYQLSPLSIIRETPKKNEIFNPKILFLIGFLFLVFSYPIAQIKLSNPFPLFGLIAIGMIVIGETIQFPFLFMICTTFFQKVFSYADKSFLEIRIGLEEIYQNSIKNTLTGAALMLAVSLVISLSQLTESYKKSILDWTDQEFPYQYSIVNSRDIQEGTAEGMQLALREEVKKIPEIKDSDVFILNNKVESEGKIYLVHGYDMNLARTRELLEKKESIYPENFADGVFISSNMAYLGKKKIGDLIELPTKTGKKQFPILGIREHFFSESGTIMADESFYEREFHLDIYRAIRFNFHPGMEKDGLGKIEKLIRKDKNLMIMSASDLKKIYLEGTEKVFSVLESLKVTACIIALISLFSSILYSLGDKMKLFGMLKSLGGSLSQLTLIVFTENLFLAFMGSLAGIVSALLLGPIVLEVINKNAFGWTLKVVYPYKMMLIFLCMSPVVAFLGTIYPLLLLRKISLREVLSYE